MADADLAVGILGAGFFGEQHAYAIAAVPGLRLTEVCDCDLAQARRLADRHGAAAGSDWHQRAGGHGVRRRRHPHARPGRRR